MWRISQKISHNFSAKPFGSLWCFIAVLIFSACIRAERLPVKTYTVADGLLQDLVTRIRQDSSGFLWFCTPEGISRFDGYGFTNFRTDDGLPDRHVNDLLETKNGMYLIATDAGLARLNPKGIRGSKENPLFTIFLPDNPKAKKINVLFEDKDGAVWVGSDDGLFKLNERFELEQMPLETQSSEPVGIGSILQDRSGALWVGSWNKLFRLLPSGKIELYTMANGLPDGGFDSLLEDANGRIWVGMRPGKVGGLVRLVKEPSPKLPVVDRIFTKNDGLPAMWITDLFESGDGKFWVATTEGLCQWQGEDKDSVCKTYTGKNDLCDWGVTSIFEDKDENLWVGSQCGAKKLAKYGFTAYNNADGFKFPAVNSIFENRAGEIFASVNWNGRFVSRFDGNKFVHEKRNLDKSGGYAGWGWKHTVWHDSAGAWWIPTDKGLFRSPPATSFEQLSKCDLQKVETGAKGEEIFRIFEDSRHDIWITTIGGASELLRWERATGAWHDYTSEAGFSKNIYGTAFIEDRNGNLWVATGSDAGDTVLIRYAEGNFKVFKQTDGVPPGWIRDLHLDQQGRLWLANTAVGILRLDKTNGERLEFVKYTTAEGLSSNGAYCVTEDEFGRIYVGTGRGLDRLNPETGQVKNFTTADGLPGSNVGLAYRDRTGALWFAANNGLARFLPEPERIRKSPTVLITGLRAAGIAQPISILGETEIPLIELASVERQVTIDFIGLGATLGEKLRYEYRITGEDWTPTNERTVNFANLSTGDYYFEVRAQTADRIYSQTPATVSFRIAQPIWQRWWFIVGFLVLTAFLIYVFYRLRIARLLELERMRTRIAADLHDDIGANLTRIALLSEVASLKESDGKNNILPSIADIARQSVASMNDIVWAISPEHESLLDLTRRMRQHAEEVFAFRDIDLKFKAPASDANLKLSVGVRRDVLLIFKEAVNNAARHSECSKVEIDFRHENSFLNLKIADNGKGFQSDVESDGQGLRSMQRRAASLGGDLKIESSRGQGTAVKLTLPLIQTYTNV